MYHFAIHSVVATPVSWDISGWPLWQTLSLPELIGESSLFGDVGSWPLPGTGMESWEASMIHQATLGVTAIPASVAMTVAETKVLPLLNLVLQALLPVGQGLLLGAGGLLLFASFLLLLECVAALWPRRPLSSSKTEASPKAVVLMPAHNEAAMIAETVTSLQSQLHQDAYLAETSLWVIADNCDDETANLARHAGAHVLERFHATELGKGYALDYGLQQMNDSPPEVVIIVDADCQVHSGAIARLVRAAMVHRRPIQGNYYMTLPEESIAEASLKDRITVFAARVKNELRSQGLTNLGLPCLLLGSGMAFPWESLQGVSLASGDLVEDMKLGFDLAMAQRPPMFCRDAVVTAALPNSDAAAQSQRTRWEHGRMDLTRRYFPKLLKTGLKQGLVGPIALALDMTILPLSLLVTLWGGVAMMSLAFAWVGGVIPLAISLAGGVCLGGAILLAWLQVGRQVLPLGQLLLVPVFILWKLRILLKFVMDPQRSWVRTERDLA